MDENLLNFQVLPKKELTPAIFFYFLHLTNWGRKAKVIFWVMSESKWFSSSLIIAVADKFEVV